jgi:CheY-like chemotaxis protein
MPNGGRLTIETSNVERSTSSEGEPPPGRWACLAVSDNGLGMPVEVQARMFDPFFTTKEVGRGTGLGLSTVLGAVQQANGRITVDSRPGGGTSFRLYFPVADASASTEKEDAVKAPAVPRRLTVLAVGCGFEAKEASTAEEGLELIERGGVDLLLTDVVMPGMSGPDLVCRLRALGSELPVVFASGYMEGGLHAVPDGAVVLTKPYAAPELTEAVARALSAKR